MRYHTDICAGKKKHIPKPEAPILMSWNPDTAKQKFRPQKSHTCIVCDTVFQSEKSIDKHYHEEHPGVKPYSCTFCDEKFAFNCNKRKHIAAVHEGKFKCDRCEQCFGDNSTLRIHISR